MEEFYTFFGSPISNAISFFVGLIGLFLAIFFYRRSLILKKPCWSIRNINIIEGYRSKISGLEVTYNGESIENLSISRFIFWNDGRHTIDKNDIPSTNPLIIAGIDNIRILDAKVLAKTTNLVKCLSISTIIKLS